MDQSPTPSFERAALEADMKILAAEIKTQRERGEMKDASDQRLIKEAIRVFPALERGSGEPQASAPVPAPQTSEDQSPLPAYAQSAPAEVKLEIEYLMDLALRKGIGAALGEAQKSSYFVQDAFHDALTGRLYPELQKQGIVK
jgi:hypothetical protein